MKIYSYISALLIAGIASFSSCSQEEDLNGVNGAGSSNGLQISVSDGGYVDAASHTRAIENGYTTEFAEGDEIGIFAVDNSKNIVSDINNRKCTMKNGSWVIDGKSIEYKGGEFEQMTFYAYYPYNADVKFNKDQDEPFAEYIESWTLNNNQGGKEYTKYDLMVSSSGAVVDNRFKGEINFTMQHCMALVVVKMPKLVYDFVNADVTLDDYELPITDATFKLNEQEATPYYQEETDTYRFLVKPGTEYDLKGSYTGAKEEMNIAGKGTLEKGIAKVYTVTDSNKKEHTLAVGDYYCADGSIVSKDVEEVPDNVIGIVCYVGNPQPSFTHEANYTETNDALRNDYPNCTHGLILAATYSVVNGEATSAFSTEKIADVYFGSWFSTDEDWANKLVACTVKDNPVAGCLGYNNSVLLAMSPNTLVCDKAVSYLKTYRETVPVPACTSTWFLPSLYELDELVGVISAVQNSIRNAGGDELAVGSRHWSSNERTGNSLTVYQQLLQEKGKYLVDKYRNQGGAAGYFRMMLAF